MSCSCFRNLHHSVHWTQWYCTGKYLSCDSWHALAIMYRSRAHDTASAAKQCHAGVKDLSSSIRRKRAHTLCHWLEATAISCIKCHGVCDDQSVFRVKRQSGCDTPVGRGEGARINSCAGSFNFANGDNEFHTKHVLEQIAEGARAKRIHGLCIAQGGSEHRCQAHNRHTWCGGDQVLFGVREGCYRWGI